MVPELWHIFAKNGSGLNLTADPYLNMIFSTSVGKDAEGYAITDPSLNIIRTHITNGGWGYDSYTSVYLDYTFNQSGVPFSVDASIYYKDVSIFNPELQNSKSISSVTIDNSTNYIYPSVTYAGAIFLDPISQGLIETEHLIFLQESSIGYISPYDSSNSTLIFRMVGDENQIQLFTIDNNSQEVNWADELIYDVSNYIINQGIQINIGFKSDEEGVYERRLIVYHRIGTNDYPLIEIVVNAQSIGEDERYDTLIENFGLFKPKSIQNLFKEADINESLPDWKLLNYKAKHLIIEHDKIMPYIGTYKALINAIKWLGYEDIEVKEWFKDVKENKLLSLYIPYDADERKKTVKYFSPEERRNLKKLNQLSLVYHITTETGELDDWGNPITENSYEYNLDEIFVKLYGLKTWLEKNIIGVNARIYDLTGEGIYFERFKNFIYGFQNIGNEAIYEQSLTPITLDEDSELINGDASIRFTLKEYEKLKIEDLHCKIIDLARYGWDPSNGFFSPDEYLTQGFIDPSAVFIGCPFAYPFVDLYDIQWKLLLEKESGVITTDLVTNPLFIHENQIKFYNIFDTSTFFYDVLTNVDVTIENAYLRDSSIDVWVDSIAYTIYPEETSMGVYTGKWIMESSMGVLNYSWGELSLQTSTNPRLMYAYDNVYKVPLLTIEGYKWTDASGISNELDKKYILDLIDGKIKMDSSILASNGDIILTQNFINFNYDISADEQHISYNITYTSPRIPLYNFDPSDASLLYHNLDASIILTDDNSIYQINVHHAGDYDIEIYGWNGQNNLFFNFDRNGYKVWQKYPVINSYIDTSCAGNIIFSCVSTYLTPNEVSTLIHDDLNPIFDRNVALEGLTLEYDLNNKPYIQVPSITYFQDLPEPNSICKFYNLTEKITNIVGDYITVDIDFQWFVTGDHINIVKFDNGKYSFIEECSANIVGSNIVGSTYNYWIDDIPNNFVIDSSIDWYLLNDTQRKVSNAINNINDRTVTCDISTGGPNYYYRINQMIAIIAEDLSTGYSWAAALRVIDVSDYYDDSGIRFILDGNIPEILLQDPSKYVLTAKHAFSAFADFQINTDYAVERNNNYHIYLDDIYKHQYYLDSTFMFLNILFDQEKVLSQWYDPSTDNMINKEFYPFNHSIKVDVSTLVILKAEYDPSNYMIDQKNIWEIRNRDTETILMKVNNFNVPYIFDTIGDYDIIVKSYDKYGNLKEQTFEGLISVKNG